LIKNQYVIFKQIHTFGRRRVQSERGHEKGGRGDIDATRQRTEARRRRLPRRTDESGECVLQNIFFAILKVFFKAGVLARLEDERDVKMAAILTGFQVNRLSL
jgi:hypothetical protein